ncbi:hypothetical protein CsatA_009265 [Cannabis sativa]
MDNDICILILLVISEVSIVLGNENPYQTTNQSTSSLLPLRFFSGSSPPSLAHHRFLYCHFSLWSLFAFAGGNDVVYSALS